MKLLVCECADSRCPMHKGASECLEVPSPMERTMLYRVDTDDIKGTRFCPGCYEDAANSGMFQSNYTDEDWEQVKRWEET